jgi:hypothetical protein
MALPQRRRRYPRYSPECVEGEFSEVRMHNLA